MSKPVSYVASRPWEVKGREAGVLSRPGLYYVHLDHLLGYVPMGTTIVKVPDENDNPQWWVYDDRQNESEVRDNLCDAIIDYLIKVKEAEE